MAVILHLKSARQAWWQQHLQSLLPELECRLWDEPGCNDDIEYAIVWRPPTGGLRQFANLKCIVSVGSGVDHVLADRELPANVPIIRTTGSDLTQRMREYVTLQVLRLHRRHMDLENQQRERIWRQTINPPAYDRRVGVMGLGNLGADAARVLTTIGFDVAGWSRTRKQLDAVTSFAGDAALPEFLARTDILVCMLPLTSATRGILNAQTFKALPRGASIINVARGEHLIETDLIEALDSGHLAAATLDVFSSEPLPDDHAFWSHPHILVTPHVASMIDPVAGGKEIARNLRDFIAGRSVKDLVDLDQGY